MPKTKRRSKDENFNVLLTDAVAFTYRVPGLKPLPVLTVSQLRAKMDAAGLLEDCVDG